MQTAPIDFNLALIEREDRFSFWHDLGSRIHRPIHSAYQEPSSVMVHARLLDPGEVVMGRMTSSAQYFERTSNMIKKDQVDSIMLILLEKGVAHWRGHHSQFCLEEGDLFALDNHDSFRCDWSAHQQTYVVFPREILSAAGWHEPTTSLLKAEDPRTRILRQHIQSVWHEYRGGMNNWKPEVGLGLSRLAAIYFASESTSRPSSNIDSNEALAESIKRWIESNLHKSELDASTIAKLFYISRSRVYELFQPWGGVRTYLKARRLEKARLILERADHPISISKLAGTLGFRSLSSFSRSFHDRWGISPKEAASEKGLLSTPHRQQTPESSQNGQANPSIHPSLKDGTDRYYRAVQRLKRTR